MTKIDTRSPKTSAHKTGNVVTLRGKEAGEQAKAVAGFVRDHPLLVVAGGIALGAVAAAFLPRGTARRLARRAVSLAEVAGTAGALLGTRVRETAEATGAGLREQGGAVAEKLERLSESASGRIGKIGEAASVRVEETASKVARKAAALRSRVSR